MQSDTRIDVHEDRGFYRGTFIAMANPCEVLCQTTDAEAALSLTETAAHEAWRIERKFSRYRDDSVVHAINTSDGAPIEVDVETSRLIDYATTLHDLTEGAFDITSGILRRAWRFDIADRKPTEDDIASLLGRVGWRHVAWRKPILTMPAGMELDFGGIGKEYAVDRAVGLVAGGATLAALINFGGDLRTVGPAPASGAWQVGIESVNASGQAGNLIKLRTGALATSGDTKRFIEVDGKRYGHIIDARTGWPASDAPRSITVAADTCLQAGTFSTLAMLQGARAEEFLREEGVRYWCLR
ncbi:MAG TPA: FAD:protein FMN transferase [Steroidobacteraceae bacterium]|nr:FAD:protein FMN transferase [Steroidobacteraceae bacterium]